MSGHDTKQDNRGLSLVELIVAVSIGVIVAGSVAALITYAIRMYRNESVNASMQYELQTNVNTIMDEIMGSSVFVIEQNSGAKIEESPGVPSRGTPYTNYALFGNPHADIKVGGVDKKGFKGVIFASSAAVGGKFKVYMDRIEEEIDPSSYATLKDYAEAKKGILSDRYLLGENVTQFVIEPAPGSFEGTTYKNPIEFKVELDFEKDGWGTKKYNKHVDDVTYMRNKVTESVFIKDPSASDFTEYKLKKKED